MIYYIIDIPASISITQNRLFCVVVLLFFCSIRGLYLLFMILYVCMLFVMMKDVFSISSMPCFGLFDPTIMYIYLLQLRIWYENQSDDAIS